MLVDDDALLDLFDRLGSDDDDRRRGFRWVLGLVLVRKKLLRLEGSVRTDEGDVFLLRRRGTDPALPPIEMLDPKLDEAKPVLEEAKAALAEYDGVAAPACPADEVLSGPLLAHAEGGVRPAGLDLGHRWAV